MTMYECCTAKWFNKTKTQTNKNRNKQRSISKNFIQHLSYDRAYPRPQMSLFSNLNLMNFYQMLSFENAFLKSFDEIIGSKLRQSSCSAKWKYIKFFRRNMAKFGQIRWAIFLDLLLGPVPHLKFKRVVKWFYSVYYLTTLESFTSCK